MSKHKDHDPVERQVKESEGKRPVVAKSAPVLRKYVVTFAPPSVVGETAARMEVEAFDEMHAVQQWREATGFLGATAVPPVATLVE